MSKENETTLPDAETVTVPKSAFDALMSRLDKLEADAANAAKAPKSAKAPAGGAIDIHGAAYVSTMQVHYATENPNRETIREG